MPSKSSSTKEETFEEVEFKLRGGQVVRGALIGGKPYVGIKEATPLLEVSYPVYTRRLLEEGKLDNPLRAKKVKVTPKLAKWFIAIESITFYLENKKARSSLRRVILYLPSIEDIGVVRKALESTPLKGKYRLEIAYKGKKKEPTTTKEVTPLRVVEI